MGNGPTNATDPSGKLPVAPVIIGAVVGGVSAWWSNGRKWDRRIVLTGALAGAVGGLTGGIAHPIVKGCLPKLITPLATGMISGLASGATSVAATVYAEDRRVTEGDCVSIGTSVIGGLIGGAVGGQVSNWAEFSGDMEVRLVTGFAGIGSAALDFVISTTFDAFRSATIWLNNVAIAVRVQINKLVEDR